MATKRSYRHHDADPDIPLSAVTRVGDTLYVSGQVGIDPDTRRLVDGGLVPQTEQTLANLERALTLAGASMADVVKVNAYLTDMTAFSEFNAVYRRRFPGDPPSRTTIGTSALAVPGMVVEIEAIAVAPDPG